MVREFLIGEKSPVILSASTTRPFPISSFQRKVFAFKPEEKAVKLVNRHFWARNDQVT